MINLAIFIINPPYRAGLNFDPHLCIIKYQRGEFLVLSENRKIIETGLHMYSFRGCSVIVGHYDNSP